MRRMYGISTYTFKNDTFTPNAGKYSSPMEHMCMTKLSTSQLRPMAADISLGPGSGMSFGTGH